MWRAAGALRWKFETPGPMVSGIVPTAGGAMAGGVANCHGGNGEGAIGPALTGLAQRMDLATTNQWIENPSAKMPKLYPAPLNAQAVKTVAAYVQGLK